MNCDLLAEPGEQLADLGSAAVHDHRLEADRTQQHDVLGEGGRQCGVDHRVAPELDHDHRATEALDVRQRLDEGIGALFGLEAAVVEDPGHERYPALMSM